MRNMGLSGGRGRGQSLPGTSCPGRGSVALADGARPALVPEDIVSVLAPNRLAPAAPAAVPETAGLPFEDELTGRLLTALSGEKPLTLDDLAALLGIVPARLADLLTRLELAGRVRALPGQRYRLP